MPVARTQEGAVEFEDKPTVFDDSVLLETTLSMRGLHHVKPSASRTLAYLSAEGPLLVEWSLHNVLRDFGYDLNSDRDNKSKYDPQGLVSALARYGKSSSIASARPDLLERAKDLTLRVFGRREGLQPLALNESLERFVQPAKSSGLPDLERKGDAFARDLERAKRIAAGRRAPDPCVAFHRVQHGDSGPKTRLVWGYPQSMFLLESRFAPQLIDRFLLEATPMAFGLFKSQVSARMQSIRNSGIRYSIDFSGFDASIAPELIDFAFGVLSSHFTFTSEEKNCWDKLVNYFIHTPLMMPNQKVWVKHQGVPSGSYFTQMIDSIVNYLSVTYAWLRATDTPIPDDKILLLGDDSVVGQSKYVPLSDLHGYFSELGLSLNVKKTGITFFGDGDPHFLGHFWRRGYPDRDLQELVIRMAFPEKRSGIEDRASRISTRVLGYVGDAVSAHKLVMQIAPAQTGSIQTNYASLLPNNLSITKVPLDLRPGGIAFLEELGTADSTTPESLAFEAPWVSIYF